MEELGRWSCCLGVKAAPSGQWLRWTTAGMKDMEILSSLRLVLARCNLSGMVKPLGSIQVEWEGGVGRGKERKEGEGKGNRVKKGRGR